MTISTGFLIGFGLFCFFGGAVTMRVGLLLQEYQRLKHERLRRRELMAVDDKTSMMLEELAKIAREHPLQTPEELEAMRRSFAYGNLKIDRPELTREEFDRIIDEAQNTGELKAAEYLINKAHEMQDFPMSYATKNPMDGKDNQ